MVFIIATACANWYYGINENFCCQGNQRILRYHLGSLTFGALVVTIVALLNSLINQKRRESQGCVQIVWCIVGCCLQCIQALLEVMNHNAVIVMAMTGESYIDSAKTAVGIIFDNYSLFSAVTIISRIIIFGGIVFSTGISTLTGILITYLVYKPTPTPILITYVGLTIFFVSFILVIFAIEMITQALQCVFIFYCFDSKFRALGIHVPNVP